MKKKSIVIVLAVALLFVLAFAGSAVARPLYFDKGATITIEGGTAQVSCSWPATAQAEGYNVALYRSGAGGFDFIVSYTTTATSRIFTHQNNNEPLSAGTYMVCVTSLKIMKNSSIKYGEPLYSAAVTVN